MNKESSYAVIQSGGKQYRVSVGDIIDVETLGLAAKSSFECKEVLLHSDGEKKSVGKPLIANALVLGEVVGEVRGPKVIAYKYKKRKKYRRKVGHRQDYTRIKITELKV